MIEIYTDTQDEYVLLLEAQLIGRMAAVTRNLNCPINVYCKESLRR